MSRTNPLDTPQGVKSNVRAIRQVLDQAGRRDYTVKVYSNGSHNLMEVPPDNPKEHVRLKRFPPGPGPRVFFRFSTPPA